jgi:hypothetical protein
MFFMLNETKRKVIAGHRGESVIDHHSRLYVSVYTTNTKALCPWEEGRFFSLQSDINHSCQNRHPH